MGPQYSHIAGTVLEILLISQFFNAAASAPSSVMMAMGKHKPVRNSGKYFRGAESVSKYCFSKNNWFIWRRMGDIDCDKHNLSVLLAPLCA